MGDCFSSADSEDTSESHRPLLQDDQSGRENEQTRVVDRNIVPNTVINLPSPGSRPPPVTFDDIPSPTSTEPPPVDLSLVTTQKGKEIMAELKKAYSWKDAYSQPTLDFSYKTNILFTSCENHFSFLSSDQTPATKNECNALVSELLSLRDHWGTDLLPLSMRNAFVRERINITMPPDDHQFRIDCIQFFEPIVFYGNLPGKKEDLVKLYVFVVTDLDTEEVIIRYYLERSYLFDFYHVLCYFKGNSRGQLKPYGTHCPTYWVIREHMYQNALYHLKSLSGSELEGSSGLHPIAATYFPNPRNTGPVNV